ncbi:hypothetical protein Tco_1328145 [Tanacetum coccineum]
MLKPVTKSDNAKMALTVLNKMIGVIERKTKGIDQVLKERDDFKVKLEKWSNASVLQNEVLNKQRYVSDKSWIDELAIRNKVVNQEKTKSSQSAIDRNKVIIEDWVDSDDEETDVSESQKETAFNSENSETSFENRSPNSQNSVGQESRTKGLGNKGGFTIVDDDDMAKDVVLGMKFFCKQQLTANPKGPFKNYDRVYAEKDMFELIPDMLKP